MKKSVIVLILLLAISLSGEVTKFNYLAKIETLRRDNLATVLVEKKFKESELLLIHNDMEIGRITVINRQILENNIYCYRLLVRYTLLPEGEKYLRAGDDIGLQSAPLLKIIIKDKNPIQLKLYKRNIFSGIDKREMLLIPEGPFYMGSNDGNPDEKPEHLVEMKPFYMDKFEVSNSDYLNYINSTKAAKPLSWSGMPPVQTELNLPVIVTYTEAESYSRWAGKRLPTEEEWEKAARGGIVDEYGMKINNRRIYPWGDDFVQKEAGAINEKENSVAGYIPVSPGRLLNSSYYGLVNMSGNAPEWTSSWYAPYTESKYQHERFGKQVKVIKGGAWYNSQDYQRISVRQFGGLPNLADDSAAGFRCVRDVKVNDIEDNLQKAIIK